MSDPYSPCSCGSGKKYKFCCYQKDRRFNTMDRRELLAIGNQFPVACVLVNEGWQQSGLASVLVSRELPNGRFLYAMYCVDTFCLGVKEVLFDTNVDDNSIDSILRRFPEPLVSTDYEEARSIVLGAIEFAGKLGFEPHPDWRFSGKLLEPERSFEHRFEFGQDGKPTYIQGPYDNPLHVARTLAKSEFAHNLIGKAK